MTDDRMDARLRAAGERWRAADVVSRVEPATSGPLGLLEGSRNIAPPRRRRSVAATASAAAVVAALAVGVPLALRGSGNESSDRGQDARPLKGTVWRLTNYGNDDPDPTSTTMLSIDPNGHLVADDACTVVGAAVDANGTSLTVRDRIERSRGCTDDSGVTLTRALPTLAARAQYAIDGSDLTIGRGGNAVHFVAMPANFPSPTLDVPTFVGSTWQLQKAVDATGANTPLSTSARQTLQIADDRTVHASVLCAPGLVAVTQGRSGTVTFALSSQRDVSRMPCAEQGSYSGKNLSISRVLFGQVGELVNGNILTISKSGVGTLYFRWVPQDLSSTDASKLFTKEWYLAYAVGAPVSGAPKMYIGGSGGSWTSGNGCTDVGGTITAADGSIDLHRDTSGTEPRCDGDAGRTAALVDALLDHASLFSVRDGALTISDGGAQADSLVYTPTPPDRETTPSPSPSPSPTAANPLDGTWDLTTLEQPNTPTDKVGRISAPDGYRFTFTSSSVAIGEPCGDSTAGVAITRTTIAFSGLRPVDTRRCYDMRLLESEVVAAIAGLGNGTATWSVDGDVLTLMKGSTTLTFDRARPAPSANESTAR